MENILPNPEENPRQKRLESVEIDLSDVVKTLWNGRKTIYKSILVFVILGLIVAFGSKVEYEASCTLLPEKKEGSLSNLGGLSGFVGLTGINLDFGSQGAIAPQLYPQIVESLPFQRKIINKTLSFRRKDTTVTSYVYFQQIYSPSFLGYLQEYTLGLPEKVRELFSGDEAPREPGAPATMSRDEYDLIQSFKNRIGVDADPETGVILIEGEMPDPVAAAELTQACVDLLLQYIIDHKINKLKENREFIKKRYTEAKKEFEQAQQNLEKIAAANSPVERQKWQDEYDLAFEAFKSVTTQLDQAEIKLKEETPVFTVVDPVTVPFEKSKPKRTLILLAAIFLGLVVGSCIVYVRS